MGVALDCKGNSIPQKHITYLILICNIWRMYDFSKSLPN